MAANRRFMDVQPGEKIYMLEPLTINTIIELTVTKSAIVPKSKNGYVWELEFYVPMGMKSMTPDRLKNAAAADPNLKVTLKAWVKKDTTSQFIIVKPAPTILATEKSIIETWLKSMTPEDVATFLKMMQLRQAMRKR